MSLSPFRERIARQYPATYRQEIMPEIMERFRHGESVYLIGISGTGKSNLFHFTISPTARQEYLIPAEGEFAFIWADTNGLAEQLSAFSVYELMLYNIVNWAEEYSQETLEVNYLRGLHREVVIEGNRILAQRNLETALRYLFNHIEPFHVVFLFDEFEPIAERMDFQFFRSLRWIRDLFKGHLSYMIAGHQLPDAIRPEMFTKGEPFHELLLTNVLGLKPFSSSDTRQMLDDLVERYGGLPPEQMDLVVDYGGGHAGLTRTLYRILNRNVAEGHTVHDLLKIDAVSGECRKIWNTLFENEREGLKRLVSSELWENEQIPNTLRIKGVLKEDYTVFSPVFGQFVVEL